MYLQYGNYKHPSAEAGVSLSRQALVNEARVTYGYKVQLAIDAFLQASGVSALTSAINGLVAGYTTQGFTNGVGLFNDDGSPTSHVILPGQTLAGVKVVDGPNFPEWKGAEYTTYRRYTLRLEAEIRDSSVLLLAFTEAVSLEGGGPRRLVKELLQGLPQEQIVAEATPFFATQVGSAVGQFGYPTPPGPIFPAAEDRPKRRITRRTPKRAGLTYTEFQIDWQYSFLSALPLVGLPNRWPTNQ
jgi:hypothetical protein